MAQINPTSAERFQIVSHDVGETFLAFGGQHRVLLSSRATGGRFTLSLCEWSARSGPPLHVHSREEEVVIVQSGCFEFHLDGERWEVGPGGFVFCPRDMPHALCVVGEEPGRALMLAWPGEVENYFRRCAHEFATGAPNSHQIARIGAEFGIPLLAPEGVLSFRALQTQTPLRPRVVLPEKQRLEAQEAPARTLLRAEGCHFLELQTSSTKPLDLAPHQHELFGIQSGEFEFDVEGERVCVGSGALLWAPAGTVRSLRFKSGGLGRLLLISLGEKEFAANEIPTPRP